MEMDAKENLEHIASFDMESKETWAQDWETDNPEFHTDEVNAMLTKHHDEVTRGRKKSPSPGASLWKVLGHDLVSRSRTLSCRC